MLALGIDHEKISKASGGALASLDVTHDEYKSTTEAQLAGSWQPFDLYCNYNEESPLTAWTQQAQSRQVCEHHRGSVSFAGSLTPRICVKMPGNAGRLVTRRLSAEMRGMKTRALPLPRVSPLPTKASWRYQTLRINPASPHNLVRNTFPSGDQREKGDAGIAECLQKRWSAEDRNDEGYGMPEGVQELRGAAHVRPACKEGKDAMH
ncbi:hypothetical protein BJY52DRAFT_1227817 [Lactarius psammicola]|nr:hypothetical protein BJY52DRAFT_1227817 [Lactarius psammicola]